MKKSDFNYQLPEHLIAQKPLASRAASRLLAMNRTTGVISDKMFVDFIDLLNSNDLLVLNDTKVIPARLYGSKQTGGKVEILIERILDKHHAMAHIRASKSPQSGVVISLNCGLFCTVIGRENDLFYLHFSGTSTLLELLDKIGHIPLPPYIKRKDETADAIRYQSVFAKQQGAVAAPTASLHFDQNTLEKLQQKGVRQAFVTLHVGSGTFQPVRASDLSEHIMHKEYYAVPQQTVDKVQQVKKEGGRIIAVGTTVTRALESTTKNGLLQAGFGNTQLFIKPSFNFNVVDAILTNFHLPESTLLMLIAAFAGHQQMMNAYQHAIKQSYRFLSYGDAMFLSD